MFLWPDEGEVNIWKSTDGGLRWFDCSPDSIEGYWRGILDVEISPFDRNTIFACSIEDGVFKSTNGGLNWEKKDEGLRTIQPLSIKFDSLSGIIYLGTYYDGIYKSTDNGESWHRISENINNSMCEGMAINYFDSSIVYVAALNGLHRSLNGAQSWEYIDLDFPYVITSAVECDKFLPDNVYVASLPWTTAGLAGFFRSTDSGDSWEFLSEELSIDNYYNDIEISYLNSEDRRIFLSSFPNVFYSDDIGETWNMCQDGLQDGLSYHPLEVSPSDPDVIAVGTTSGSNECKIFLSDDRGDSWSRLENLPGGISTIDIEFDPYNSNIIYTGLLGVVGNVDGGLFKSTDFGESWIDITNNLPLNDMMYFSGITINPFNTSNIFVIVGWHGVYQTHDGGETWESFNEGLDTASCVYGNLSFAGEDTTHMYLSTLSVWSISRSATKIVTNNLIPININIENYPNPFNSSTNISFSLPKASEIDIDIYDLLGRKITTLLDSYMPEGNHTVLWQPENISSGIYFYKITAGDFSISKKMILLK